MLVSGEERRFSFQTGKFDLQESKDRKFLGWVLDQFLYGEVTGIQCGHWLYRAPHLNAATFLARQATEELSHVRKVLRIFTLLGELPQKPHWAVRFLSSGMMGGSWGEHVAIEMALGEGLVLNVFYALADTIPDPEIEKILKSAAIEEERHVEFGEKETHAWIQKYPQSKGLLLGLALVQLGILRKLKRTIVRKLTQSFGQTHPVASQFEDFYVHVLKIFETQIERLGLWEQPLNSMTAFQKVKILGALPFRMLFARFRFKSPLLTEIYLDDPTVVSELKRFRLSSSKPE